MTYMTFEIFHGTRKVGETTAVSADKATTNYWWRNCKNGDKYKRTEYRPSDFTARIKA